MMKLKHMLGIAAVLLGLAAGPLSAGTEGTLNTFYGQGAGTNNSSDSNANTFIGANAGTFNTTGFYNTFLGFKAGYANQTGYNNVFLGFAAGYSETGSNKLYLDNCLSGAPCTSPLIYGEFDNHLLRINGVTHVAANGVAKSQMHFSLDLGDSGGWLTSVLENNFFVSSGARYDSGNWVQRSADGNAVMAGSGGVGYRIFTHTGTAVGNTFNNPTLRLQIDYAGQFGINTSPVAGDEIHTSSGAHLTSGGVWTDASSREYKEHIIALSSDEALQTLSGLTPVRYNYKVDPKEEHVGFIAEDVPMLVATRDRKSLAPMDIVAVLTRVLQEKSGIIDTQNKRLDEQDKTIAALVAAMSHLEARLEAR
jgi:hypothetical protein